MRSRVGYPLVVIGSPARGDGQSAALAHRLRGSPEASRTRCPALASLDCGQSVQTCDDTPPVIEIAHDTKARVEVFPRLLELALIQRHHAEAVEGIRSRPVIIHLSGEVQAFEQQRFRFGGATLRESGETQVVQRGSDARPISQLAS